MKSVSSNLTSSLKNCRATADNAVDDVYSHYDDFPWDNPHAYGNWLAQTYYYVRHATRVLSYAAARCPIEREPLHRVFLQGIKEEVDHEILAENDLKTLGYSLKNFPELTETALYHQSLRYAIDTDGSAALLGYFLPLEGLAAVKMTKEVEWLNKELGPKACSFLNVHCKLDVSHYDEGLKLLESLTPTEIDVVQRNIEFSKQAYINIVESIKSQANLEKGFGQKTA